MSVANAICGSTYVTHDIIKVSSICVINHFQTILRKHLLSLNLPILLAVYLTSVSDGIVPVPDNLSDYDAILRDSSVFAVNNCSHGQNQIFFFLTEVLHNKA